MHKITMSLKLWKMQLEYNELDEQNNIWKTMRSQNANSIKSRENAQPPTSMKNKLTTTKEHTYKAIETQIN